MTEEQKRVKIAKACGWRIALSSLQSGLDVFKGETLETATEVRPLPDFFNDLNAMHEVEKALTKEQHQAFRNELAGVCGFNYDRSDLSDINHHRNYVSATATQRAEAFGRVKGLW